MNTFTKALISLLVIQLSYGKPITEANISETAEIESEFEKELQYLTTKNSTEFFVKRIIQTASQTLNDPQMIDNHNEQVEEFKKNLTMFLDKCDEIKKIGPQSNAVEDRIYEESLTDNIIKPFFDQIEYYFELPKDQQTADTELIVQVLKKYDGNEFYKQVAIAKAIAKALANVIVRLFGLKPNVV